MNEFSQLFRTSTGRALTYFSIFIVGLALYESLFQIIRPIVQSGTALVLDIGTLCIFAFIGAGFASQQHIRSRLTSVATLLILGIIALSIGHHAVPDPYLLAIALCVALVGAQPVLHRKATHSNQATLYSALMAGTVLVFVFTFTYALTVIDRISFL